MVGLSGILNLRMPAPHQSRTSPARLDKLLTKTDHYRSLFEKSYPEIYSQLQTQQHAVAQSGTTASFTAESKNTRLEQNLASELDQEEFEAVMTKAQALTQLPPGKIDTETALYLEQQLGELLGFQVATKLQDNEVPHSFGIVRALPHLKRSPTDERSQHDYSRAPFLNKRGYFGWLPSQLAEDTELELLEKYYLAIPFFLLPNWDSVSAAVKKWYSFRKMVLINPFEQQAVVCVVGDSFDSGYTKYQFGASPEVILEGKCWSPATLGKVLIFFVLDDENQIPLGPVSLRQGTNA